MNAARTAAETRISTNHQMMDRINGQYRGWRIDQFVCVHLMAGESISLFVSI